MKYGTRKGQIREYEKCCAEYVNLKKQRTIRVELKKITMIFIISHLYHTLER
jgi:hypothetical protein